MKILWVEDGGAGLPVSTVGKQLFKEIIPLSVTIGSYPSGMPPEGFSLLFNKHTLHELIICRSFGEWTMLCEAGSPDFDVAILDINLEASRTPVPPIDVEDFDKRAGLFIFHELTREHGFSPENIAFFTGEGQTLLDFAKSCTAGMLKPPANLFEKRTEEFEKISNWLRTMEVSPYLKLRRGILDGCEHLMAQLGETPQELLPAVFSRFRPAQSALQFEKSAYRERIQRYVSRVQRALPMAPPKDVQGLFCRLIVDMTEPWTMGAETAVEHGIGGFGVEAGREQFARSRPKLLSLIHEWARREYLVGSLDEQQLAFVFLLVSRSWLSWETEELQKFERLLMELLPSPVDPVAFDQWLDTGSKRDLEISYNVLEESHERERYRPATFVELCLQLGEGIEYLHGEARNATYDRLQRNGFILLIQAFWHGLTPTWIDPYSGNTFVSFDILKLPKAGFLREIGSRLVVPMRASCQPASSDQSVS